MKNKKRSTTKRIITFLLVDCVIIQIVTMILMFYMIYTSKETGIVDFTPLMGLITAVVGEVVGFLIYSVKATKENTAGGVTYELAMREKEKEEEENG